MIPTTTLAPWAIWGKPRASGDDPDVEDLLVSGRA